MADVTEQAHPRERKEMPVSELLGPVREALQAMGESQRRSEAAMRTVLESIERVVREQTADPAPIGEPETGASTPDPTPSSGSPESERPRPQREEPKPESPATEARSHEKSRPEAEKLRPEVEKPKPSSARRTDPPAEAAEDAVDGAVRQRLLALQRHAGQLDRLTTSDDLGDYLSTRAAERGLRQLLLVEKGRNLHAVASKGFETLDDRAGSLSRVVVPFDPESLFGTLVSEEMVYSGPRPVRGMPVDLVLIMGKKSPAWCVVVPLHYRNRWGRFLYVDGTAEQLDALFELEVLARLAVLQLRASRARPHRPADGLRKLRNLTLKERREKRSRGGGASPREDDSAEAASRDPLSRRGKLEAGESDLRGSRQGASFDEEGRLIQPLKPKEILARIGEIPPMPHVAAQLLSKLNDPETTVQSLQEVIATDQTLSARLLQIANSSLYGNMREVSVIGEAVMRLGFNAIRSWLLSTVTRAVFVAGGSSSAQHRLWRQSVLCAMGAQLLAERSGKADPELAFVAGLLQNIGLLLLARNHPEVFLEIHENCSESQMPYHEGERQALGFDHADLGSLLLQKWGLAVELVEAVARHHRLELAGEARGLAAVIALAEEMAFRLGEGPTEATERSLADEEAAAVLELEPEVVESVHEELAELALDRSIFEV